jgi:hypothetical protein
VYSFVPFLTFAGMLSLASHMHISFAYISQTKAFDNKTSVLQYLVKVIRQTNRDILKFQEDIKSVVLAKGVAMDRLLTSTKKLCQDSRTMSEIAAKHGDEYRKCAIDPTQKVKIRDVKSQRASVKELRQMATFINEVDVPIGKTDTTHFERFGLFAMVELQKALGVIQGANQNYISMLEYYGADAKTPAADFFGVICQFILEFDLAAVLVEREEEMKLKEARRALAKEAKLRVKSIARVLKQTDVEYGTTYSKPPLCSMNHPICVRESLKARAKEELVNCQISNHMLTRNATIDESCSLTVSTMPKNFAAISSTDDSLSAHNDNAGPSSGSIVAIVATAPRKYVRETESGQRPAMATVEARIKESGLSSVDDSPWLSKLPTVEGMVNISSAAAAQRKEKQRQSSGDELSSQDLLNLTSKKQSMERLSQKVVFGSTIAYPQLAELKGANRQPSRLSLAVAAAAQHRLSAS